MNPAMLTNVNAKRLNQSTTSSKSLDIKDEDIEVSYKEVLKEEFSAVSKQNKRGNQGKSKTTHNNCPNPNGNEMLKNLSNNRPFGHIIPPRPFPSPPPRPQNIKGDINADGKLDQADVATLEKYNNGEDMRIKLKNADINEDGVIDEEDAKALQKFVNPNIGDVNGDGKVTQADVHTLKEYQAGNIDEINNRNADFDGNHRITDEDVEKLQNLVDELHPDMGDANSDGIVNAKDVDLLQKKIIGLADEVNMDKADMDGDGEITVNDLAKVQQLVDEHEAQVETIIGDTNGDGAVDESDHANLKNYIENTNSSEDFIRKNSDVNSDGKIDEKDLQGLRDKLDGINVNYSEGTLTGDVNGDGKVTRADREALNNYVNRESNGNDEFYINNADVNGDGTIDKDDVATLSKQVEPRHRPSLRPINHHHDHNDVRPAPGPVPAPGPGHISGPVRPNPSQLRPVDYKTHDFENRPPYQPWTATLRQPQPLFTDSDLSSRSGAQFLRVGVKINVIAETNNAYQVSYPSNGSEQVGWIGKNAFQKPQSIQDVLQNLISEFVGKTWTGGSTGRNSNESRDFASFIFDQMNNVGDIGYIGNQNRGYNFRINVNANFVGMRGSNQFLTNYNARSLFSNAQIGDFVQMRRHNGDSHSAILTEINAERVQLMEINAPDQNGSYVYNRVNLTYYSYEQLANNNSSMSIYYPKQPIGEEV